MTCVIHCSSTAPVLSTKMCPVFPLSSFIPSCQPRCVQSFHCHPSFRLVNQDVSSLSIVILHSVLSTKMSPVFPLSSFIPSCQPRCLQSFHCHPSFRLVNQDVSSLSIVILHSSYFFQQLGSDVLSECFTLK